LNTVVANLNKALWAASLNFVIIPGWIRRWEGGLSSGDKDEKCQEGEFSNKICHVKMKIN
jgi:hypothetical protein